MTTAAPDNQLIAAPSSHHERPLNSMMSLRLSRAEHDIIRNAAVQNGMTVSSFIRFAALSRARLVLDAAASDAPAAGAAPDTDNAALHAWLAEQQARVEQLHRDVRMADQCRCGRLSPCARRTSQMAAIEGLRAALAERDLLAATHARCADLYVGGPGPRGTQWVSAQLEGDSDNDPGQVDDAEGAR